MLIQSDRDSGEPLLYEASLPSCITMSLSSASKSFVLLLDAQIGTGAAALMAVRVLLDHGVPEENIILCALLVSRVRGAGIWALEQAFPRVRVLSSAADEGLEERTEETRDGPKKVSFSARSTETRPSSSSSRRRRANVLCSPIGLRHIARLWL